MNAIGYASPERSKRSSITVLTAALAQADISRTVFFYTLSIVLSSLPFALAVAVSQLVSAVSGVLSTTTIGSAEHHAYVAIAAIAAILAVQQVLAMAQGLVTTRLANQLDRSLRRRAMVAVLCPTGTSHLEDPQIRDLVAEGSTVARARYNAVGAVFSLQVVLGSYLTGVFMLLGVARFNVLLALALLVTWLVVRTQLRRENLELWKVLGYQTSANRRSEYYRDLAFTQQAAKEIRVFGLGGWLRDGFEAHWRSAMSPVWTARRGRRSPLVALFGVVVAVNVVAVILVVRAAESGHLGIAGLTLALQGVVGAAVMGNGGTDDVLVDWGAAPVPALARLERTLAPLAPKSSPPGRAPVQPPAWDGLRLEKVAFGYPGQVAGTLESVDLELRPGRSLALVGANGAGKTTIIKLICRLIEPGSGAIFLGGVDLARVDPLAWRRQVAVVFQDFVHYPASIGDNVRFGAIHSPRDQQVLEQVADLTGVGRFVAGLSDGWATELSREVTGGTELSGGQWQSVALARALYALRSGAKVLILDEPTANLDARAEAIFYDRFLDITRGVTTILVSHRFSTVRKADEILRAPERPGHRAGFPSPALGGWWAVRHHVRPTG